MMKCLGIFKLEPISGTSESNSVNNCYIYTTDLNKGAKTLLGILNVNFEVVIKQRFTFWELKEYRSVTERCHCNTFTKCISSSRSKQIIS